MAIHFLRGLSTKRVGVSEGMSIQIAERATTPSQSATEAEDLRLELEHQYRLCYNRGKMFVRQKKFEAALFSFKLALQSNPQDDRVWVHCGVVLMHLKRYHSALLCFDKAIQLSANNREAWIFRGAVLSYLDRFQDARKSYSKALKIQNQGGQACIEYPLWLPEFIGV